ncbi:MAG: xanthine dehydrogenase family protein [Chloroflexi bacterium]|nr:xanthine dehydrogenase family protein [Chloroflexota bacterium]
MSARKWVGTPLKRKEDPRFLTGKGTYTDDLKLPGLLHVALLRSPHAHARILSIDASAALAAPGVVYVMTGEEVRRLGQHTPNMLAAPYNLIKDFCMAGEKVRYVGEAVAAVVAETKYQAEDALELVQVDYEPLPAVMDTDKALEKDAPLLHEEVPSNHVWHKVFDYGDVETAFREADHVTKARLHFHRFTSAPMEPNVIMANYDPSRNELTIWSNSQRPVFNRRFIARGLNLPEERLRFICPDIGGGFGIKNDSYPYMILVGLLALRTGRPVKWVEDRTGHLQASAHGSEIKFDGEIAMKKDGTILGVRARAVHDEGAYIRREPIGVINFIRHATVSYRFQNLRMELSSVVTNKCPVGPNRSYGKMQQCFLVERLIDMAAREMGLDPVEIRLKNFVAPEEMPYESPSGCILDGGDYPQAMRRAVAMIDYAKVRQEQAAARQEGRYIGIGIALGMDACPVNSGIVRLVTPESRASGDSEAAWIRMDETGRIVAACGSVPQGQGHETVIAQIIADELGVTPDDVYVNPGLDSARDPSTVHSGTYASRFAIVGVGAVLGAAAKIRDKILRIAAHNLESEPSRLELNEGKVIDKETGASLTLRDVAHLAWRDLANLPDDLEAGLYAHHIYRPPFHLPKNDQQGNFSLTYSYSVVAMVVEVDSETGKVKVKRMAYVDDCGTRINPLIVEGQIHGQIGHQLGAALYEQLYYDDGGQLVTSTFKDYLAPTAADIPHFEVDFVETPSLFSPLGARGMGEGGGSPLIAAISAVSDALAPFGVELTDTHLAPERTLRLIQGGPQRDPGL